MIPQFSLRKNIKLKSTIWSKVYLQIYLDDMQYKYICNERGDIDVLPRKIKELFKQQSGTVLIFDLDKYGITRKYL